MTKLETINAEDLQNRTYEPTHFLVDELIPEGLHILAGAPKIGKSWLALWLCLCVAQGQPLWNFATTQGEALYLSLEDSFQRIQTRLFDLTEDTPPTLHFAIMADTLKHGLEQQIEQFLMEHPTTKLVVIDTLQRVRGTGSDSNLYANDYQDIGLLKKLADNQHIAILLIHHLRKLHDDDPMNMISGSTGLSGAADSTFVLQKHSRLANIASLHCTGRDIPDRTLKLEFGEDDHVWKRWNESSRLRYRTSPCTVVKFQSGCPCETHKHSHKASQDLPIFGAPARMCKPSGISSSTRKCVGSYVLFCSSSALMVCSLFILSPPSILLSRFLFSISPHRYRNIRIDF